MCIWGFSNITGPHHKDHLGSALGFPYSGNLADICIYMKIPSCTKKLPNQSNKDVIGYKHSV